MDVWEIHRLGVRLRLEIFHGGDTGGSAVVQRVTRSKQWIFPGAPRFDEYLFGNAVQYGKPLQPQCFKLPRFQGSHSSGEQVTSKKALGCLRLRRKR